MKEGSAKEPDAEEPAGSVPEPDLEAPAPEDTEQEDNTCCGKVSCFPKRIRNSLVNHSCIPSYYFCFFCTWSKAFWLLACIVIVVMFWATSYFLFGAPCAPGGAVFGFFVLCLFAYSLGWTLTLIPYIHLPPVFGMLLAGIIVRNAGWYNINDSIGYQKTATIRTVCMTTIMLRAGLQLAIAAIRDHAFFILLLALIPCTVEMLIVTVCCKLILSYPWNWSFLTGTIVACMSPVVTVNCMLALADRGYGEDKSIATLLCTATSIDGVHIVAMFAIFFSFVFSVDDKDANRPWWKYIPGGVRDILLGTATGIVLGLFFVFFPHRNHKHALRYRIVNLVVGSIMCTTAAPTIAITGAGFIATVILASIASNGWRYISNKFDVKPLRSAAAFLWHFTQPVLLGVIGADIDFNHWHFRQFGLHVSCIVIGLLTRCFTAALLTIPLPFTMSERVFVAIAWLPKGTVQAALAPMAFEQARSQGVEEEIKLAEDVVKISVVAIVFLAPLGAIAMMVSGPLLLNKISDAELEEHHERNTKDIVRLQPVKRRRSSALGTTGNK